MLDLWLDKFDSIGQPAARKLSALALCVLLPAPLPGLLERLELIATHITSVWFEVRGALAFLSSLSGFWVLGFPPPVRECSRSCRQRPTETQDLNRLVARFQQGWRGRGT